MKSEHAVTCSNATPLAVESAQNAETDAVDPSVAVAVRHHIPRVKELFERYRAPLLAYLTRLLLSKDDAEDVLQETYARLLNADALDGPESRVRAYLFKIGTNLAYDRFRARRARGTRVDFEENRLSNDERPDDLVNLGQGLEIVKRALLEMRPRSRQVLLLRISEQLSYQDIALRLSVSTRTVEREMRHAIDLCQRRLRVERDR